MDEIGLVDAIDALREELVAAMIAGEGAPIQFPVASIQLTFQVAVTRDTNNAGRLRFLLFELGHEHAHTQQSAHTVTLNLDAPVDLHGDPVKVLKRSPGKP